MEKTTVPVAYDAARHVQQVDGRWRDRVSKRLIAIDPSTVPHDLRAAPSTGLQGVELPQVEVQAPAQAPAQPAQAPAQPAQAPAQPSAPPSFSFDALPDAGGEPDANGGGELPHVHIQGCYKGHAEGRLCACGVRVYEKVSEQEAIGSANMVISVINRFSPNPLPLESGSVEEKAWIHAFQAISERYGSPWVAFAPHLAVLGAVLPSVMVRRVSPGGIPGDVGKGAEAEGDKGERAGPVPQSAGAVVESAR